MIACAPSVRQENLPFVGSSHEFVGAEHGDVNVSVFLLSKGVLAKVFGERDGELIVYDKLHEAGSTT